MNFFDALVPICICVVLPVVVVWLICRVRRNETDRKAEIMLKALENGATIDAEFFKSPSNQKTLKERLLGRLTGACVTGLLGVVFLTIGIIYFSRIGWDIDDPYLIFLIIGGALLAVGIALFLVYLLGKRFLAKDIDAEEKRITEGK